MVNEMDLLVKLKRVAERKNPTKKKKTRGMPLIDKVLSFMRERRRDFIDSTMVTKAMAQNQQGSIEDLMRREEPDEEKSPQETSQYV